MLISSDFCLLLLQYFQFFSAAEASETNCIHGKVLNFSWMIVQSVFVQISTRREARDQTSQCYSLVRARDVCAWAQQTLQLNAVLFCSVDNNGIFNPFPHIDPLCRLSSTAEHCDKRRKCSRLFISYTCTSLYNKRFSIFFGAYVFKVYCCRFTL